MLAHLGLCKEESCTFCCHSVASSSFFLLASSRREILAVNSASSEAWDNIETAVTHTVHFKHTRMYSRLLFVCWELCEKMYKYPNKPNTNQLFLGFLLVCGLFGQLCLGLLSGLLLFIQPLGLLPRPRSLLLKLHGKAGLCLEFCGRADIQTCYT